MNAVTTSRSTSAWANLMNCKQQHQIAGRIYKRPEGNGMRSWQQLPATGTHLPVDRRSHCYRNSFCQLVLIQFSNADQLVTVGSPAGRANIRSRRNVLQSVLADCWNIAGQLANRSEGFIPSDRTHESPRIAGSVARFAIAR